MRYLANSPEITFWQEKLRASGLALARYIEELRNHVTDTSKVESFYIYYHWRVVDEKAYYNLKLAMTGLSCYCKSSLNTHESRYIFELLAEELLKNTLRFKECKFFKFFTTLGSIPYAEQYPGGLELIPIREYLGNYEEPVIDILKRCYTVRYETPRRIKRKTFHRGYDDKGSESSVSERARRAANTIEFPYLTKDFLEQLRRHKDPLGLLRELGYLLRE